MKNGQRTDRMSFIHGTPENGQRPPRSPDPAAATPPVDDPAMTISAGSADREPGSSNRPPATTDGETVQLSPEAEEVFCLLSDVERYIRANMRPPAKGPLQRLKEACSHGFLAGGRKSRNGR